MGVGNRYEGVDEFVVQIVKQKAGQLIGQVGFTESDREDLEQELMIYLLSRLSKFDASRGSRESFIRLRAADKVASIIQAQKREKRDYRRCTVSLDQEILDGEGRSIRMAETIAREDCLRNLGRTSRPPAELQDLQIDLHEVMARLPEKHRALCEHLIRKTVIEISEETGVHRNTVYYALKKLRRAFEEAGLEVYLKSFWAQ